MPTSPRPPIRWCNSFTDLDDFALINWAVDAGRVQAPLPAGWTVHEREGQTLVSMVAYVDLGLITPGQLPAHAGIQRRTTFDVHTPPTRIR